jgi:hypothetical protein
MSGKLCNRVGRNFKSVARRIALAAAVLALGTVGCGPSASAPSESDPAMTTYVSEDGPSADFNFDHAWLVISPPPDGSYVTTPPDVARSGYTDPGWERVDEDTNVSDTDARVLELPQALNPQAPTAEPRVESYR